MFLLLRLSTRYWLPVRLLDGRPCTTIHLWISYNTSLPRSNRILNSVLYQCSRDWYAYTNGNYSPPLWRVDFFAEDYLIACSCDNIMRSYFTRAKVASCSLSPIVGVWLLQRVHRRHNDCIATINIGWGWGEWKGVFSTPKNIAIFLNFYKDVQFYKVLFFSIV